MILPAILSLVIISLMLLVAKGTGDQILKRPLGGGLFFSPVERPGVSGDGVAAWPAPKRYGRFKQTQLAFGLCRANDCRQALQHS
jgi:hypothetical protein